MEQTNSLAMSMLQSIAGQATALPRGAGKSDGDTSDFQKLLDEKAQEKDPLVEQPAKTQDKSQPTPAKKTEKAPVQKQENALERAKKLAEQGAWFTQPSIGFVDIDLETGETIAVYQPGEYVLAHLGGQTEIIPITDLEPWEQLQLQQLVANSGQAIDVSDPEADALLEATAPGADNSPAEMLEQIVDGQASEVAQTVVEEVQARTQPQTQAQTEFEGSDDDQQVEVTDVEQAPQRIFHDVQAAPVKVGEAENLPQADEADVVKQVENQIVQAVQQGESTVSVRLNPENLGEVTVQVSMKSDGVLAVAISARNDDTRALLERHATNLQELLSSRVRETVEINVQRQQESQQSQHQQQSYDGHNGHAQDGQQERRRQQQHSNPQDFMQQLRLGLIPTDGEL